VSVELLIFKIVNCSNETRRLSAKELADFYEQVMESLDQCGQSPD
jgi:hypothetical protein